MAFVMNACRRIDRSKVRCLAAKSPTTLHLACLRQGSYSPHEEPDSKNSPR